MGDGKMGSDLHEAFQHMIGAIDRDGGSRPHRAFWLPAAVRVLNYISQHREATASDLAELGFSRSTLYRVLTRLGDLGLIDPAGDIRLTETDRGGKPAKIWRLRTR